MRHGS